MVLLAAPPGWAALRTEVLHTTQAVTPELGTSVLSAYLQLAGRTIGYTDVQAGPPHQPVFAAQVHDANVATVWCRGGSKKTARQAACWEMLHVITGTHPRGDPSSHPDLLPPRKPPPPTPPSAAAGATGTKLGNPISMLNESAQHHHLLPPGYTYTTTGPHNEPTFTATAAVGQRTAQGTGSTKNTAKTRAAAGLLAQLMRSGVTRR